MEGGALRADPAESELHLWYDTVDEESLKEQLPTELNTSSHPRYLAANKDKLTIRYVGKGNHTHDVGAIRTNRACPHRRLLYYFEITVVDAGSRGSIAIGLADASFELNRQPGWEPNSYAYHGEDGRKYSESERGEAYGPTFAAGDVVGCGLLLSRREIFFTLNGRDLGPAFTQVAHPLEAARELYPTLGLHSPDETVVLNLGGSPFRFDVQAMIEEERQKKLAQVMRYPVPLSSMAGLVRSYLLHFSHEQTLLALDASSAAGSGSAAAPAQGAAQGAAQDAHGTGTQGEAAAASVLRGDLLRGDVLRGDECGEQGGEQGGEHGGEQGGEHGAAAHGRSNGAANERANGAANGAPKAEGAEGGKAAASLDAAREAALSRSVRARRRLRELLLAGDVAGASAECEAHFPKLIERNAELRFLLCCQSYIELVREGKLLEAVAYARDQLAPYREAAPLLPPMHRDLLPEVVALIAYPEPAAAGPSPARLMGREHREKVAEVLNGTVLRELGLDPACALERLLRQLVATHAAIRDANHGCGEGFRLLGEAAARPVASKPAID